MPRAKTASQSLKSFNPRTGEVRKEIPVTPTAEVVEVVERARKMVPEWASIDPAGRARALREVRHRLHARVDDAVRIVSEETGKTPFEALAYDIMPTLLLLAYFEKVAPKALRRERVGRIIGPFAGVTSHVDYRPFGVVGAITPWNYPLLNCFLAFAPALFAGNTVVIKPSEVTPDCGELARDLLEPLPPSVATIIQGGGDVGAALVDAPCDKISFIGSPKTGRKICEAAAKHLTPVVMELGGKDSAIVCADADLDRAASGVGWGAFMNCGQTCTSIERVYVVDSVADEFERKLLERLQTIQQGDDVGPLTFKPQLEIIKRQVKDALDKGARVLAGGPEQARKNHNGSLWYTPTVVTDVDTGMNVLTQESFGPVLAYVRVPDEEDAIRRANEDGVNLTASVWTRDKTRAQRLADRLRAGVVTVNLHAESPAAPWAPWGGVGESGFGRLNGIAGLREFTVPTHIERASGPNVGRMWWYPHDEATKVSMRALVDVLGSPETKERVKAAGTLAANALKSMKAKF
ncbi:MAG TPA: aldehyde dehydrogenase family protein [Actinomycetota bacterium]|nr:aldehyde dehydrogenase family protein [Actinomycetota bacterium]